MSEQYMVKVYELEEDFYGPFNSVREAEDWVETEQGDLILEGDLTEVIVLNLP